jgi:hypothetical protein
MRAMRLSPYEAFHGVRFGESAEAVVTALGEPLRRSKNRMTGEDQLQYADIIVRLAKDGSGVIEFSARPSDLLICDDLIPLAAVAAYIHSNDPEAKENVGFLSSQRFGLMVDLEHEDDVWITAFTRDWLKRFPQHA